MKKLGFTPASVDTLRQGRLRDPLTDGLYVEVLASGGKVWRFRRRLAGSAGVVKLRLGVYPSFNIAAAREWAMKLNQQVEAGVDPREAARAESDRERKTVDWAHGLYMKAVDEGRASRAKRKNKPRTIADKLKIYRTEVAPTIGKRVISEVTERELITLVLAKGKIARIRANRLAAELKVFFGWAASLRGLEVGLETNPAARLDDLKFPETPRSRTLGLDELEWFLKALSREERDFRRGMLLWLLTATRFNEVVLAEQSEFVDGVWTIPAARTKNGKAHSIALGPWGRSLMETTSPWLFPAQKAQGPRRWGWYQCRDRLLKRMEALAGRPIEHFTPHDFRRTARSNTKRLRVDFETAEAMMNHVKAGLERIYDGYALEDEKAAWFLKWENEVIGIASKAGVLLELQVPTLSPT